jgi:hypothetical protein
MSRFYRRVIRIARLRVASVGDAERLRARVGYGDPSQMEKEVDYW